MFFWALDARKQKHNGCGVCLSKNIVSLNHGKIGSEQSATWRHVAENSRNFGRSFWFWAIGSTDSDQMFYGESVGQIEFNFPPKNAVGEIESGKFVPNDWFQSMRELSLIYKIEIV